MPIERPSPSDDELQGWCLQRLGSGVEHEIFRSGHLSSAIGVRLEDGREVVVKVRRGAARLDACFQVQLRLFERGFSCPEPLVAPSPLGR